MVNSEKDSSLNNIKKSLGLHDSGYLFICDVLVKLVPVIDSGLLFVCVIKKK